MPCAFSNHCFPSFLTQGLIHLAKPSGQRAEGLPDFAQNPVLQIQTQVSMLVQQITPCFFFKGKKCPFNFTVFQDSGSFCNY